MDNAHLKKTWEKGIKALEQSDFARAIASLKKVEKAVPDDPDVHFAMADAFLGQGKADQAIRQARRGADAAPNAIESLNPKRCWEIWRVQKPPFPMHFRSHRENLISLSRWRGCRMQEAI